MTGPLLPRRVAAALVRAGRFLLWRRGPESNRALRICNPRRTPGAPGRTGRQGRASRARSARNAVWWAISSPLLASCGGGGSSEPVAACIPLEHVTVVITGNSIAAGLGDDPTIRILLHARFGDAVTVVNRAIGGTELSDIVNGTAGFQAWPLGAGHVTIILDGTNEARRGTTPQVFAAYLERVARPGTVLVTPPPMDTTAPLSNGVDTLAYAQAVRSVATAHGLGIADAYGYTLAIDGGGVWRMFLVDGVHPNAELYQRLARDVVAPAAGRAVAPLLCQDPGPDSAWR